MVIRTEPVEKGTRYIVQSDTGSEVAWFGDLQTAGLVLRYLKGTSMSQENSARAVEAIRIFDAERAAKFEARAKKRAAARARRKERMLQAAKDVNANAVPE